MEENNTPHISTILSNFVSEKDLATQLGHHERTLARWRQQRTGPKFILNGRQIIYHRDDVNAWLRAGGIAAATARKQPKRRKRAVARRR